MNPNNVLMSRLDGINRTRVGAAVALIAMASAMVLGVLVLPGAAGAAGAPVGLGTARFYSVLGGSTVTNTGPSVLNANLGVSPGSAITGFPPGLLLAPGVKHKADAAAASAKANLVTAYNAAAGRALTASIAGDLVGQTLVSGVYKSKGPIGLTGTLTLDAQGDPTSVFIFQIASTLITASASHVSMINGAQACNVFWQVGSSATLGTTSTFKGTIMALTSITVKTGTTVEGRALARNGAVTLDNNVFTTPGCDLRTPPVSTPPVTTPPVSTPPVTTPAVSTAPVSISATDTTAGPSAGPKGTRAGGATTPVPARATRTTQSAHGVLALSIGQSGASQLTTAHAQARTGLAFTGLSPMLRPMLVLGALLAVLGACLLLAGARRRTAYVPRH